MHELGLCESIVVAVERRAAGRPVRGVRVRVGSLHRVVGPAFDQAFEIAASGTVAEGAQVELVTLPVRATCRRCQHVTTASDPPVACEVCAAVDLDTSGGDELVLESIEVDGPAEAPGPAPTSTMTGTEG